MDAVLNIYTWASSEAGAAVIFGTLFGIMAVAQLIVNTTATPRDNEILGKVYTWVERAAGIWGYKAKMLPGESLPLSLP